MTSVQDDAQAFWLRAPGCGEIRPVTLPEPGRDDVLVRTAALRRQPRHRDAGVPRRRAAEPVRRDARAVPGGRLPGAGQVRLPQRRRRRAGPARRCSAAPSSACTRTRPPTWCRPPPSPSCPTTCRPRGPCSPAPWRPRSTPCGTPRRCSATGSRSSAPAWSAAASRACWPGSPACRCTLVDVDAGRADVAAALGRRLRAAGRRRRRPRPGRAHQRDVGRAAALARPARARGHRHRSQLVRRRRGAGCRSAARSTRAGSASAPARSARSHRPAAAAARRPTGWRSRSTCCATRPSTRSITGESPLRRAARGDGPAGRRAACRRSATPSPTARGSSCSA